LKRHKSSLENVLRGLCATHQNAVLKADDDQVKICSKA